MMTCEACGNAVPEGNAFCTSCGAVLPAPAAARIPGAPGVTTGDLLSWERKIPLITNPYLVIQGIAVPAGIGVVLGLLFRLITGTQEMLLMFVVPGGFLALVFLLVMLVLQIVTGGGLLTTFFISSQGLAHKAGSMTSSLNRAATAGSVLLGSTGGIGAGLLAMSQECNAPEWKDIWYMSVYPSVRSLVFRSPLLISPVVLYCTEENFPACLRWHGSMPRHLPPGTSTPDTLVLSPR
jgi:hypothetical protein